MFRLETEDREALDEDYRLVPCNDCILHRKQVSDERAGRVNSSEIYSFGIWPAHLPGPLATAFASDEWPNVLIAPTGSGKTAGVTLGWAAHRLRAPRRHRADSFGAYP